MTIQKFAVITRVCADAPDSAIKRALRSAAPAIFIFAGVLVCSIAGAVDTRVVGVAGSDTTSVLTREVAELQARVKKLEGQLIDVQRTLKKADTPDDDGSADKAESKKNGGAPNSKDPGSTAGDKSNASSKDGDTYSPPKDVFPTMTLRAPFVVVDASGKAIFRVNDPSAKGGKSAGDRGVYIYGPAGAENFALTTVYSGGKMVVQTDSGAYKTTVGALDKVAGIRFRGDNKTRAYIGLDNSGKGNVSIYAGDSEQPIAALQATDAGKGLVAVFNDATPVAFLTQSTANPGGGNVTTTDPGGSGVFSAGYAGDGGAACVNHKQAMHCLGIGLPLGQ